MKHTRKRFSSPTHDTPWWRQECCALTSFMFVKLARGCSFFSWNTFIFLYGVEKWSHEHILTHPHTRNSYTQFFAMFKWKLIVRTWGTPDFLTVERREHWEGVSAIIRYVSEREVGDWGETRGESVEWVLRKNRLFRLSTFFNKGGGSELPFCGFIGGSICNTDW